MKSIYRLYEVDGNYYLFDGKSIDSIVVCNYRTLLEYCKIHCSTCIVKQFCKICWAQIIDNNGVVSIEKMKIVHCPQKREELDNTITLLLTIQNKSPYLLSRIMTLSLLS